MIPAAARLGKRAGETVSAASSAVFRVGFGVCGLLLVARFFAHGWIDRLYIDPPFHFTYPGFGWVAPWPGWGMYLHFALLGLAALGIALGYRYRASAALFAVLLTYAELIDRTLYLNHYYWLALTGAVISFLPLNRMWSLDARAGRVASETVPVGVVWLLRFQVGMVYFFAGLAKVNPDWLFDAQPLATWLPARSDLPVIGPLLAMGPTPYLASWAAMFFDMTIVAWLLYRPTRRYGYAAVVLFHTATWILFPNIGLFPLVMTVSALIFFDPDWPVRLVRKSRVGEASYPVGSPGPKRLALLAVAVYALAMVLIPLRHFAIPDEVPGQGYLWSWQVMLTEKVGSVEFRVTDPDTGKSWVETAPDYLTDQQEMVMSTDPAMMAQVAEIISADNNGAEVEVEAWLTVNGEPSTRLVLQADRE